MDRVLKNPWIALFCFAVTVRVISTFGLYFLDTPFGDKIADNWRRFLPHTIVFEVGLIAALFVVFRVLVHGLKFQEATTRRLSSLLLFVLSLVLGLHLILAQMDNEVMRWLGQHLNVVWLKTYVSNPDISMMMRIYADDIIGIAFSIFCVILAFGPTLCIDSTPRTLPIRLSGDPVATGGSHRGIDVQRVVRSIQDEMEKDSTCNRRTFPGSNRGASR